MVDEQTYLYKEDIPLDLHYPVIWLASWYPSKTYPANGDFIQRHAKCVDVPVLVIHTIHAPEINEAVNYVVRKEGTLIEIIIRFRQANEGKHIFQRILYHHRYQQNTKHFIAYLVEKIGKPYLFHVHVPMKMGPIARWAKHKWGIPYIVSEQSSKYVGDGPDHFVKRSARHRKMVARVFQEAESVTNVSSTVGKVLQELFNLARVDTIHNVADASLFYPGKKNDHSVYRFLHASTLTSQKNIDGIIRVMEQVYLTRQDFSLTVLGGERHAFYPWKKDQPWLVYIPTVSHEMVADYMRSADTLLMFSNDENFPCVIVEALCTGMSVITSDAGGSAEAINAGNGLLVPVGNEKALAKAILDVMNNKLRYNTVDIRQDAVNKFSYPVIGHQFRELYRKLGVSFP
jgi:glycosyltransferase involved in cell wall biosynthesis